MKILIPFILIILSACSSLSKEECSEMDWKKKGFDQSIEGRSSEAYLKFAKQCRKHSVEVPHDRFFEGYREGLKVYCTYSNGFKYGSYGRDMFTECEPHHPEFRTGYIEGFQQFKIKKETDDAIDRVLSRNNTTKCSFSGDCRKRGYCESNRCLHNGLTCTFDSDCTIVGDCVRESEYIRSQNKWIDVNFCRYR